MEDELKKQLERLNNLREETVKKYLDTLATWSPGKGSLEAIGGAAILHDLDRHITNLESELKRLACFEVLEATRA